MQVCIITSSCYPATVYGGPVASIKASCEELANRGVTISVATTNANGNCKLHVPRNRFVQISENLRVKYYNDIIIGRLSLSYAFQVWRDIKQNDIVSIQDIFSTIMPPSLLYSFILGRPVVLSARGVLSKWALTKQHVYIKRMWLRLFLAPFHARIVWHATSEMGEEEPTNIGPTAEA